MWWKILFLFPVFHALSTVNGSTLRMPEKYTCYNSSDPTAQNASLLYDDRLQRGELWNRDDLHKPLPPCSAIGDRLSDHTCEVCRDKEVFVVCQNLSESVDLRMEGSRPIRISRCVCDQLTNKAFAEIQTTAPTPAGDKLHWSLPTAVIIIIIIVFIAAVFICRDRRRKRQFQDKDPEVAVQMTTEEILNVHD